MKETRLLTAIVPFHDFENNFAYLKDLIGSVSSTIEMIIVCDSILPTEFKVVESSLASYSNLILLNENFRSAGKSRNAGLQKSTTPWVVFWDCDDKVDANRYLELVNSAKAANSDLLVGQIQSFDSRSGHALTMSRTRNVSDLATYPAFTRIIYRRSFIADFRFPDFPQGEDQCFLARLLARDPNLTFFSSVLYYYRINNSHQTSNRSFDYSSHLEALDLLNELLKIPNLKSSQRIVQIIRFRLLVSMLKRVVRNFHPIKKLIIEQFLKTVFSSPWLLWFAKPRRIGVPPESFLPKLILVGGLGNQIFQYVYMINRFGKGNFQISSNLGNPRTSLDGSPEICSFAMLEELNTTRTLLSFKTLVCKYLLILSSHGNSDHISRFAFSLIQIINRVYGFFNNGVGLIFLANGVGYFEDHGDQFSYKYFIGCFHSYKWLEFQNSGMNVLQFNLRLRPQWLISILDESEHTRFGIVHIRRGDYTGISNLGFLKMSYFQEHMRFAFEANQVDEFLIFSDDPDYVKTMLNPEIATKCRIIDFEQNNASANLVAMTAGRYFILSNSTFSWWGASLAGFKEKTVIAPKSWFANNSNPKDIYPVEWILKEVVM